MLTKEVIIRAILIIAATSTTAFVSGSFVNSRHQPTRAAYSAWLEHGNTGSETEFLAWVDATANQPHQTVVTSTAIETSQDSAYAAWLDEGNTGTEREFFAWIRTMSHKKSSSTPAPIETIVEKEKIVYKDNQAYSAWRDRGHTGSETDFIDWVKVAPNSCSNDCSSNNPSSCPSCPVCPSAPVCPTCPSPPPLPVCPADPDGPFALSKFESQIIIYDGQPHELTVTGAPEGTQISYANHVATDMGTHRAFARLFHPDLGEKLLTATMTITKADIEGITFADSFVTYDGALKNIAVTGTLPEGVSVSYSINNSPFSGATDVGVYQVTAFLSGGNYHDLTLTAALVIQKAQLISLSFNNKSVEYDGQVKTHSVSGAPPAGVSVSYVNPDRTPFSGATIPGAYPVVAVISGGTNYHDFELESTLTITKAIIRGITFVNKNEKYDGQVKTIAITGTLPEGVTVKYTLLGNSPFSGATEPNSYYITATLTGDYYETLSLSANLYINRQQLDQVTSVTLGDTSGSTVYLNWSSVSKASYYRLHVYDDQGTFLAESSTINALTYNIRGWLVNLALYAGDYSFQVIAYPNSINASTYAPSEPSASVVFSHTNAKLRPPTNIRIEDGSLKWDPVASAFAYYLKIAAVDNNGDIIPSPVVSLGYYANASASQPLSVIMNEGNLAPGRYRVSASVSPASVMPNGQLAENKTLQSDFSEYSAILTFE